MYISPEIEQVELECEPMLMSSAHDGTLDAEGESIGGDSDGIDY